jgi:hypothetical protein
LTKTKANAVEKDDAPPDFTGDDDVHAEPTKVGAPNERATSKMSPFQLETVLERLAETSPDRSQTRAKRPMTVPAAGPTGDTSMISVVIAAIFFVLTCAVLLGR